MIHSLRLGPQGRLVIPAGLRRSLALKPGDVVVARLEKGRLILEPRRMIEEELWDLFVDTPESLAEELIRERREEARREGMDEA